MWDSISILNLEVLLASNLRKARETMMNKRRSSSVMATECLLKTVYCEEGKKKKHVSGGRNSDI